LSFLTLCFAKIRKKEQTASTRRPYRRKIPKKDEPHDIKLFAARHKTLRRTATNSFPLATKFLAARHKTISKALK